VINIKGDNKKLFTLLFTYMYYAKNNRNDEHANVIAGKCGFDVTYRGSSGVGQGRQTVALVTVIGIVHLGQSVLQSGAFDHHSSSDDSINCALCKFLGHVQ